MRTTAQILICTLLLHGLARASNLSFIESSAQWGLTEPLTGIMSHAAACGDVDNDGDPDLYVGNFCDRPAAQYLGAPGPVPNLLLINNNGRFTPSPQPQLALQARTSGAAFLDLDNDGDLDLYVSNNSKSKGLRVPNALFENVDGSFREVPAGDGSVIMGGRSISPLDYDGDGLLDLLVAEDKWTGKRTRLLRNKGRLQFEDVSQAAGLPADLPGLGVITPDLNDDGRPDIFVAQANRLFLSTPKAAYTEADSSVFHYAPLNDEDTPCGVAFADFNRDARMDIVIVDHAQPARQHLYVNLGLQDGAPRFKDVTAAAGLDYRFPSWTPDRLHLKHAHVEIADFDNDGWPDILIAATYRDGEITRPFICRNTTGAQPADAAPLVPRFDVPPVDKADAYFAAGPAADYDGDGRLDLFMASWFPQIPSKLFLNRTESNHYLRVKVVGRTVNRMGIGANIKLYAPGQLGIPAGLIAYQEIATGQGFCSGHEAVAHFGLGQLTACDLEILLPHNKGVIRKTGVKVNQSLLIRE